MVVALLRIQQGRRCGLCRLDWTNACSRQAFDPHTIAGNGRFISGCLQHTLALSGVRLFVQDPTASVKYYEERFGMKLVDVYHSPTLGKSNYYLASVREGKEWPEPGTTQASILSNIFSG